MPDFGVPLAMDFDPQSLKCSPSRKSSLDSTNFEKRFREILLQERDPKNLERRMKAQVLVSENQGKKLREKEDGNE